MDTSNSAKVNTAYHSGSRSSRGKALRTIQSSLSTAMSEALYEPQVMERPSPLACRVKDAGKEFLRHNQTCQWIQHMLEKDPGSKSSLVPVDPSMASTSPPLSDIDQLSLPDCAPPLDGTLSYEEQLKILHRQQVELLEQQHRIEHHVAQQKKVQQAKEQEERKRLGKVQTASHVKAKQSQTMSVTSSEGQFTAPVPNKRRLKGNVAQTCASRDEGSIGSLLWQTSISTFNDRASEKTLSSTDHAIYLNPSIEGRQIAINNESGTTVSQLLSHWPSDSSAEEVKNMYECSDTMLTDSTLKVQDESSQELYESTMVSSCSSVTNDNTESTVIEKL